MTLPGERNIEELLRGIELFAGIEDAALSRLAVHAEIARLPGGETLLREGDPSDALFVVASVEQPLGRRGQGSHSRASVEGAAGQRGHSRAMAAGGF